MSAGNMERVLRLMSEKGASDVYLSASSPILIKINGQLLACMATNKAAEPNTLVLRVDFSERDELIEAEPDVYYLKDHYVDYACVLVRLKRLPPDALPDLLRMAWQFMNSKAKKKRTRR